MAFDSVKIAIDVYEKARNEFRAKMKYAFSDIFDEFFEKYPKIKIVKWNQYTPYFNDGDPCTFRVDEIFATNEDLKPSDISDEYDFEGYFVYNGKPSNWVYKEQGDHFKQMVESYEKASVEEDYEYYVNGWKEFVELLNSIPEDIYKSTFEDHSMIIVTKDGIEVREYDHD
jgi:hypothetical protein